MKNCPFCHGYGYEESVAYYYGRVECNFCCGLGKIKSNGDAYTEKEWDEALYEMENC